MGTLADQYLRWRRRTFPASKEDVSSRHDYVNARLDHIEQRFDHILQRFDHILQRFDHILQRFDHIEQRFDRLEQRFDRLEQLIHSARQREVMVFDMWHMSEARTLMGGEHLEPIFSAKTSREFIEGLECGVIKKITALQSRIVKSANGDRFLVHAHCCCCHDDVNMHVDFNYAYEYSDATISPNWREQLLCPKCHLNNRQRLIGALCQSHLSQIPSGRIYLMEQVTPFFKWANAQLNADIVGSEYLGLECESGACVDGVMHQDVLDLSFDDSTLDLIVSNDVLEHVPSPAEALRECARVLRPGGVMFLTIPFSPNLGESLIRAQIVSGKVVNLLDPVYHGNPLSAEGSLVFTDFGWDFLNMCAEAGFVSPSIEVYAATTYGHLGGGLPIFRLLKGH
jgi:Methyltransferase domain